MKKYKNIILVILILLYPLSMFSQGSNKTTLSTTKIKSKVDSINYETDSLKLSELRRNNFDKISRSINTLNNTIKNANQPDYFTWASVVINILLFGIALFQFIILHTDRKAYLVGNTFVKPKNYGGKVETTEEFLKNYSEFYLQLTNTGKTTIEEIWIKIPDCMEFNVEEEFSKTKYRFKYFNYPEPIRPEEKVILFFDDVYFFGDNFKLHDSKSNIGEIKFRDYKGKIFNKKVAFKSSVQKEKISYTYKLGFFNGIVVRDGKTIPFASSDWDKI